VQRSRGVSGEWQLGVALMSLTCTALWHWSEQGRSKNVRMSLCEGFLSTRPLRTCGCRPLVRTRAANNLDFGVTHCRSRSSVWVFFEFVSCTFAEGLENLLLGRITCWDLLIATNGCQQDENSMQVAQVWTTCKVVKATAMA
jgi:hypothetical protein